MKLNGLEKLIAKFRKLPAEVALKVLPPALEAAGQPILDAAKAKCPVNDGFLSEIGLAGVLRDSLDLDVTLDLKSVRVRVTERKEFTRKAIARSGRVVKVNPAAIAHLVEFGHAGPAPAPAHPFMRPAWDEQHGAAERIFQEKVHTGLEKFAGEQRANG